MARFARHSAASTELYGLNRSAKGLYILQTGEASLVLQSASGQIVLCHRAFSGSVLGRVIENAVHVPVPEFAQANLFAPLGIARSNWTWNYDLTNADKEYSQIHLRPRDMLKLGILFANGGRWHGRQILSESWVRTSLAKHSHVDNVSYGYFWWRPWLDVETPAGSQHVDVVAAEGNGGQKIYLVPQYDLVAVFTAGGFNAESTPPNAIMAKIILPKLMNVSGHRGAPRP